MKRVLLTATNLLIIFFLLHNSAVAQVATPSPILPSRWDELTASDWPKALDRSSRTCILPIGILEKHGPHVPEIGRAHV